MNNKIFIVHGHDSVALLELEKFLKSLKLDPIILKDQDDGGKTIIEKFEHHAETVSFAFVLLTPDDKQANELNGQAKWRARQNVILEMGWFMAKLGRSRVALLHSGDVEIPTDISGVIYMSYRDSIFEASEKIRQRLKARGFQI